MDMAGDVSADDAAGLLGFEAGDLDLDEDKALEIAALIDPAMQERNARMKDAMPRIMGKMMTAMEPAMKTAMSEIYAVYFDAGQLAEIDAFFSTPTGGFYARQSMKMSTDPRFLAGMMQAMPGMMGSFADMEAEMKALMADLPEKRSFAELGAAQRARLVEITGLTLEEIEQGMEFAVTSEARGDDEWSGNDDDAAESQVPDAIED
jgi:hypothetical protein